jgi:deoxyribonuclease (pyrimidine dimer)
MAEYRELPMVHASLSRSLSSKRGVHYSLIPKKYTLNKGHVTFFYNKGKWLFNRWTSLIEELKYRGYDVRPEERVVNWKVFTDNSLYNDWCPDNEAHRVNVERIIERIEAKPQWYRYMGKGLADNYLPILHQIMEAK